LLLQEANTILILFRAELGEAENCLIAPRKHHHNPLLLLTTLRDLFATNTVNTLVIYGWTKTHARTQYNFADGPVCTSATVDCNHLTEDDARHISGSLGSVT